ncbi:MAG: D-alanyl-D-alanine carboxypeptidase/D-alanyl-D-alanine-endopeptidase [Synechococcaceae cyanobacterium]
MPAPALGAVLLLISVLPPRATLAAFRSAVDQPTLAGAVGPGLEVPALPPLQPLKPATLLANLPAPPPPVGLPQLQSQISCPSLQQRVASVIGGEASVWSFTVADGSGRLLADINGTQPRKPASNQTLLSTAFALDRLGPDHRLSTRLWRLPDGSLRLTGQGDPDLALPQLRRITKLALSSGGSSGVGIGQVKLQLAEEPAQVWWPAGWNSGDRYHAYGAPITRLAITSNAIDDAVMNPNSRLRTLLQRSFRDQGGSVLLSFVPGSQPIPSDAVLLHEEPSTSMHGLLSLANTESHNFTAEVLLRQAADTWDLAEATRRQTSWLTQQGLPMAGVQVRDGSGLDRSNRLTSRFLTALLLRMDHHPYARDYVGSMAIVGQRGTLRNLFKGTSLDGQVFGKTGTLTGVRAISGILQTSEGPRYFSAISNGASAPNQMIGALLRQVQTPGVCSSLAAAAF